MKRGDMQMGHGTHGEDIPPVANFQPTDPGVTKYRAFIMTSFCNIAAAGDVVRNERG